MTIRATWLAAGMFAVALSLATLTSFADGVGHDELMAKIASARTRADHEAIAAIYDSRASEANVQAAEHRRMATFYKGIDPSGTGRGAGFGMAAVHCSSLADFYAKAAQENTALAKLHRDAGAGAK